MNVLNSAEQSPTMPERYPRARTTLALLRFAEGLTQRELAARAGVRHETVCRLEAGNRPSRRTATKLAAVLGADVGKLFPDVHDPQFPTRPKT